MEKGRGCYNENLITYNQMIILPDLRSRGREGFVRYGSTPFIVGGFVLVFLFCFVALLRRSRNVAFTEAPKRGLKTWLKVNIWTDDS